MASMRSAVICSSARSWTSKAPRPSAAHSSRSSQSGTGEGFLGGQGKVCSSFSTDHQLGSSWRCLQLAPLHRVCICASVHGVACLCMCMYQGANKHESRLRPPSALGSQSCMQKQLIQLCLRNQHINRDVPSFVACIW
jgi:hypothetical protein